MLSGQRIRQRQAERPKLDLVGFGISGARRTCRSRSRRTASRSCGITSSVISVTGWSVTTTASRCVPTGDYYKIGSHEYRIFNAGLDQPQDNLLLTFQSAFTAPRDAGGHGLPGARAARPGEADALGLDLQRGPAPACAARPDLAYDRLHGRHGRACAPRPVRMPGTGPGPLRLEAGREEGDLHPVQLFKLSDKKLKYKEDIIRKNTINSDLMRYELHRVWEVEGTLQGGQQAHLRQARVLPRRGQLVRRVRGCLRHPQAALAHRRARADGVLRCEDPLVPAHIWHDLNSGAYYLANLDNEMKSNWDFNQKGKWADFQPDALRRLGTK